MPLVSEIMIVSLQESPYVFVDTADQLENALARGQSPILRAEGSGGIIDYTKPITLQRGQEILSIGEKKLLRLTLDPGLAANPAGITMDDDCRLTNFKLQHTAEVTPTNPFFGVVFPASIATPQGSRAVLQGMEIFQWNRCVTKNGGATSTYTEDIRFTDCYFHSFSGYPLGAGVWMTGGLRRMKWDNVRVVGRVGAETHLTGNGVYVSTNVEDCLFEDVYVSEVDRHGFESLIESYVGAPTSTNLRTTLRRVITQDTGQFGISIAHGKGSYLEGCRAIGANVMGIEIASQLDDPSWATLIGCEVDNLRGSAFSLGFSLDNVIDTHLFNCRVKDVDSTTPDNAWGMRFYRSERGIVQGCYFEDAGDFYLEFDSASTPDTNGYHSAMNNVFRQTTAVHGRWAMIVRDTNAIARNNIAYEKMAPGLRFGCTTGANGVRSENGIICPESTFDSSITTGGFLSSNIFHLVP